MTGKSEKDRPRRGLAMATLYQRLVTVFFLVLIPFAILSISVNRLAEKQLRQQYEDRVASRMEMQCRYYNDLQRRVYMAMRVNIMTGYKPMLAMDQVEISSYMLGQQVTELFSNLQQLKQVSGDIMDIAVFMPRINRVVSLSRYYNRGITEQEQERLRDYAGSPLIFLREQGAFRLQNTVISGSRSDLPMYTIEVTLSDDMLLQSLNGEEQDRYAIVSAREVSLALKEDLPVLEAFQETLNSEQAEAGQLTRSGWLYWYRMLEGSDQYLVSYASLDNLLSPLRTINFYMALTAAMAMLGSVGICLYLSRSINRPLRQLQGVFKQVEAGNLDARLPDMPQREREFSEIFHQFDQMMGQIRELMAQQLEQEKALQQSQYRELQARVAPHFLYNSFNVLRHSIQMEDQETAEQMARLLAKYFRHLNYMEDRDSVALEEEYAHTIDYLSIQQIRFGSHLELDIMELPENCRREQVPPFILQPLVENVFKHGIRNRDMVGRVTLSVQEDAATIRITVRDNGSGMESEELERLRKALQHNERVPEHFGLSDIQMRLQIFSQGRDRLELRSEPGVFFESMILLTRKEEST